MSEIIVSTTLPLDLRIKFKNIYIQQQKAHLVIVTILSSGIQFLSHNLLYSPVGVYHLEGIQRRMPQVYVKTFIHHLLGYYLCIHFE